MIQSAVDRPEQGDPDELSVRRCAALWVWAAAAVVAVVPAAVLFGMNRPGLNMLLSLLAIELATWLLERRRVGSGPRSVPVSDAVALLLAMVSAISANPVVVVLSLIGALWSCAVSVLQRAGWRGPALDALRVAIAPVQGLGVVFSGVGHAAQLALGLVRSERQLPVVRGVLWALPLLLLFFVLLADADATLLAWRSSALAALQDLSFLPRLLFWLVVTVLVSSVLALAARPDVPVRPDSAGLQLAASRTATERLIILGAVVALFALFLLLQLGSLFANAGARPGSGVTYAQSVHQGFGQLLIVAGLSGALLLMLHASALRRGPERPVRLLSLVLLAQCLLLLLSAWLRLAAYVEAYGYTIQRVCVQVGIVAVAAGLLVLLRQVLRGINLPSALRQLGLTAAAAALLLCVWNIPAWVVQANVARAQRGHALDWAYLIDELPLDAVPAVVGTLAGLDAAQSLPLRCRLLRQPPVAALLAAPDRWFEWNWRRHRALAAAQQLRALPGVCDSGGAGRSIEPGP